MRLPESIRAVTFDVGGTLVEPWPSVGHIYAEEAAKFGMAGLQPEVLNRQFASVWKSRNDFDCSRAAWRELVNQTFASLSSEPPGQHCFDAIYNRFATAPAWRVFEDVFPVLEALRVRGFKLGIISNWDERLHPLLGELRLSDRFDAIVVSHDTGYMKPAPEIFRRASAQLRVAADSILHVGDSVTEDVAGARGAGMQAVLLDRALAQCNDGAIPSLAELVVALAKAPPGARPD